MKIPRRVGPPRDLVPWAYGKCYQEQDYLYPDGRIEVFTHFTASTTPVMVFALDEAGNVVAIRQFRHAANQVILELPGGCQEPDQSLEEAARHELLEETGHQAGTLLRIAPDLFFEPANNTVSTAVYLAQGCKRIREPKPEATECLEILLIPLPEWIEQVMKGDISSAEVLAITFRVIPHLGGSISLP